jgi:aspartyl-tRNA(Asn)/glutamyl-tRNA(Gln) amidotransferase subunit A
MNPPTQYPTAASLVQAYRDGRTCPSEIVETALAASAAADRAIFICLTAERARREAWASTQRYRDRAPLGPLDGVPLVWKDLFDMAGTVTTAGSALRRDHPAVAEDCLVVARLRDCGMPAIGKVNLSEFAYSGLGLNPHFGTPSNPFDTLTLRVPGGSSSASAVAVARGLVPVAIGTDTGGSIRVPAAFNGLVGLKTSTRRIDKSGVFALSESLDTVGPLAHCVADCIALDAALRGVQPGPMALAALSGLRIVVPTNIVLDDLQPAVATHFAATLQRLSDGGARVVHRRMTELDAIENLTQRHGTLAAAEAYRLHRDWMESPDKAKVDPRVVARLERGAHMRALDLLEIQAGRVRLARSVAQSLDGAVVLMPTVPHVAPRVAPLEADTELFHRTNLLTLRNTIFGNFLDWCGVALPMGRDPEGMPTSLLLSAPWGQDEQLLAVALAVEALITETTSI